MKALNSDVHREEQEGLQLLKEGKIETQPHSHTDFSWLHWGTGKQSPRSASPTRLRQRFLETKEQSPREKEPERRGRLKKTSRKQQLWQKRAEKRFQLCPVQGRQRLEQRSQYITKTFKQVNPSVKISKEPLLGLRSNLNRSALPSAKVLN